MHLPPRFLAVIAVLTFGLVVVEAGQAHASSAAEKPKAQASPRPSTTPSAHAPDLVPFWKDRPELLREMREERAIVVSARRQDLPQGLVHFTVQGAGVVHRDKKTCYQMAQQYARLKDVSDHFKVVNYDAAKSQLFVVTEALGYRARMILKLHPIDSSKQSRIEFDVVWGTFQGMHGQVGYEAIDGSDSTEASLQAVYEAKEFPLPKSLMGVALEAVVKRVAENLRHYLETQPLHRGT